MEKEKNKLAVLNAMKVIQSCDPDLFAGVFEEHAEWIAPKGNATAAALDMPDHLIGRDRIAAFFCEKFNTLFVKDFSAECISVFCDEQTVIIEQKVHATLSNGRIYDNDYCLLFELNEGKIFRVREYMDTQKCCDCILG
jgi:ketosteroid isomerase-like protein